MIDVVWCAKPSSFNEIQYSVHAAQKHLNDIRRCWILSVRRPRLHSEHCWLYCQNRGSHKDQIIINNLVDACRNPKISDPFMYSCDDMYFLRPVDATRFSEPVALEFFEPRPQAIKHKWRKKLHLTLKKLKDASLPYYNYSTHVPYVIHKDKFLHAVDTLGTDNQLCSFYFNTNYEHPVDFLKDTNLRAGFYKPALPEQIEQACADKLVLNHNDNGLSEALKAYIRDVVCG